MVYRMIFNQTAYFGRGAIKEIPGVARSHGFTKRSSSPIRCCWRPAPSRRSPTF